VGHSLYPPVEPFSSGVLDVGDGNRVYWEECGNPNGTPPVALHGGPGSGCVPGMRRPFDPVRYRVVLFDQRGCGRSAPHASDPSVDLSTNTTDHLIADIELLRTHLKIERWLVAGWSWYDACPGLCSGAPVPGGSEVLISVTTTSPRDVEWITGAVGRLFPAAWARFVSGLPEPDRAGNLAQAYARLLDDPNPVVREKAAADWCDWEASHINISGDVKSRPRFADPAFRMCFARLVTHYWGHTAWREPKAS
jgi:proline iminopeptidase